MYMRTRVHTGNVGCDTTLNIVYGTVRLLSCQPVRIASHVLTDKPYEHVPLYPVHKLIQYRTQGHSTAQLVVVLVQAPCDKNTQTTRLVDVSQVPTQEMFYMDMLFSCS